MTNKEILKNHLHETLFAIEKPKPSLRGKVRDIFLHKDYMHMVNTDRISAFDQVLGTIPLKGALLCEQTEYWFSLSKDIVKNHLIDRPDPQILICKKAIPFKVEVIVRGYLAGSLMREDKRTRGQSYGLSLDPDVLDYQKLINPIITPTTKADYGEHDQPISPQEIIGRNLMTALQWETITTYALALFSQCSEHALKQGLLLVDTKYEFGLIDGHIHVIDEIHTSDSSRFFLRDDYEQSFPKKTPLMLDKEFLRQYLLSLGDISLKDLTLSDDIRLETAERYLALTEKITGQAFSIPQEGAKTRVIRHFANIC